METEVEMPRARLEEILNGLEQADPDDVGYDPQLIREMHAIINHLHSHGYNLSTVRQGRKLVVEIEPVGERTTATTILARLLLESSRHRCRPEVSLVSVLAEQVSPIT
jgi:hypothetical protein